MSFEIIRTKQTNRSEQVVITGFTYKKHAEDEADRMNRSLSFPQHHEMPLYKVRATQGFLSEN